MNLRHLLLPLLLGSLVLVAGCESKGSKVTGQLLVNGKPYIAPEKASVSIVFASADTNAKLPACSATYDNSTGNFTVNGPTRGRGILPGKYKVAVTSTTYGGSEGDQFKDAFSLPKTPLTYEVTAASEQSIVIDLTKRTITAK